MAPRRRWSGQHSHLVVPPDARHDEVGLAFAQGPETLRRVLAEVIEDGANEMNALARLVIRRAAEQWRRLDEHIAWCDERIAQHARDNPQVQAAGSIDPTDRPARSRQLSLLAMKR